MRKIYFILFFSIISTVYSQELKGSIEYSLIFTDDENLNNGDLANYFKKAKDNSKYISFMLDFNNLEMNFYPIVKEIDGVNTSFSIAFSGVNGSYYRERGENTIYRLIDDKAMGKHIVTNDLNLEWKLENEQKKISELICYKATAKLKSNNGNNDFFIDVVAWYCPQIPYSYAPKGYNGLPGVVLELHERNVIIAAKNIDFNKEILNISKPKGKTITEKEYIELFQKFVDENDH